MPDTDWIPDEDWKTIVQHVPIVSVDLVTLHDGGVVLAKRQNEPAKGEWFVPGGRVQKHERLADAVHRVAQEELGINVEIVESLGAYEHLYDTADVEDVGGKHYLANGFVVEACGDDFKLDSQHSDIHIFQELPDDLHEYTELYLRDVTQIDSP